MPDINENLGRSPFAQNGGTLAPVVAWTRAFRAYVNDEQVLVLVDGQNPVAFVKVMATAPGVAQDGVLEALLTAASRQI